jgi:MFS family permease
MSNGAMIGMTAVYGYSLGFSIAEISILTSLIFLGCVVLQFPIGFISDAFDRRKVIIGVTFCAALVPLYSTTLETITIYPIMITFFILGGLSFSMYSLCVSHANDRLETDQLLSGSATLALIVGVGAVLGSPIISYAMAYFGNKGYLWYFVIIHFAIGLFALYRMTRSSATPMDEQDTTSISFQVSAIAPAFTTETYLEIVENAEPENPEEAAPKDD